MTWESLRTLRRSTRGASMIQMIILAGCVALACLAGFGIFSKVLKQKTQEEGQHVLALNAFSGSGGSAGGGGGAPASAGPGGNSGAGGNEQACTGGVCPQGAANCFVAGTPVLTPEGQVPIETVRTGDHVLARGDDGEIRVASVGTTYVRLAPSLTQLTIEDARGALDTVLTTPEHRFWLQGYGWRGAGELTEGARLMGADGEEKRVRASQPVPAMSVVYNFEVDDIHTYFAGAIPVLVHNPNYSADYHEGYNSGYGTGYDNGKYGDPKPFANPKPYAGNGAQAYADGYNAGASDGHYDGKQHASGQSAGSSDGFQAGKHNKPKPYATPGPNAGKPDIAYVNGYNAGANQGYQAGQEYSTQFNAGANAGSAAGFNAGKYGKPLPPPKTSWYPGKAGSDGYVAGYNGALGAGYQAGLAASPLGGKVPSGYPDVFRGDGRPPSVIFSEGFQPKKPGANVPLLTYAATNCPSQYVSTSYSKTSAGGFCDTKYADGSGASNGYVYTMVAPTGGKNVNGILGANSPKPGENEIAYPGGVPPGFIKYAQKCNSDGSLGPKIYNPSFACGGGK